MDIHPSERPDVFAAILARMARERRPHQNLARQLLANRHPWGDDQLVFLRAMVVWEDAGRSEAHRLSYLAQQCTGGVHA